MAAAEAAAENGTMFYGLLRQWEMDVPLLEERCYNARMLQPLSEFELAMCSMYFNNAMAMVMYETRRRYTQPSDVPYLNLARVQCEPLDFLPSKINFLDKPTARTAADALESMAGESVVSWTSSNEEGASGSPTPVEHFPRRLRCQANISRFFETSVPLEEAIATSLGTDVVPQELLNRMFVYRTMIEKFLTEVIYVVHLEDRADDDTLFGSIAYVNNFYEYNVEMRMFHDQTDRLIKAHLRKIGTLWETPSWLSVAAHAKAKRHEYTVCHKIPKMMRQFYCVMWFKKEDPTGYDINMRSCADEVAALSVVFDDCSTKKEVYARYRQIIEHLYLRQARGDLKLFSQLLGDFDREHIAQAATAAVRKATTRAKPRPVTSSSSSSRSRLPRSLPPPPPTARDNDDDNDYSRQFPPLSAIATK